MEKKKEEKRYYFYVVETFDTPVSKYEARLKEYDFDVLNNPYFSNGEWGRYVYETEEEAEQFIKDEQLNEMLDEYHTRQTKPIITYKSNYDSDIMDMKIVFWISYIILAFAVLILFIIK